jgi:hypothetical protein
MCEYFILAKSLEWSFFNEFTIRSGFSLAHRPLDGKEIVE